MKVQTVSFREGVQFLDAQKKPKAIASDKAPKVDIDMTGREMVITTKLGVTRVPIGNVASYRLMEEPEAKPAKGKGK